MRYFTLGRTKPANLVRIKLACRFALVAAAGFLTVTSARASTTDDSIESSARNSYVFKTFLKDDAIKTESKSGAVTLTGTVADIGHKSLAQDTVESIPGVTSVDNQLKVKTEKSSESSDAWVGTCVKTTLVFHRNVRATKTVVNVANGIVTLTGEASSQAQKELTTEYAKDVEGVKEVKNEMTVINKSGTGDTEPSTGQSIDDASITAQVKSSLSAHRSTGAGQISSKRPAAGCRFERRGR